VVGARLVGSAVGSVVAIEKWLDPTLRRLSLSMTWVLCTAILARSAATSFAARTSRESFSVIVMSVRRALCMGGTSAAQTPPVANSANPNAAKVLRVIVTSGFNGALVRMIPEEIVPGL
jgi:nucleoside recognition membrane protein YjiH